MIGAPLFNDGANTDEGRAFVYHGCAAGLSASPNNLPDDANQAGASFGYSVAGAGDVNSNGYSDLIIGAPYYDDSGNADEGRAFLYFGVSSGLQASPVSIVDDANQAGAYLGCSVATAGDANADGKSDVIIGAYGYDDGGNTDEGRAFVYHGSGTGLPASPSSTPDDANQAGANFGYSVACAGDVNGDGDNEVLIGAPEYDDGANTAEGQGLYVYHGSGLVYRLRPTARR
ncbi:MAG: FG-GAP repeat protein [Chitinophagaceae bacterium]|nr:FG-GAP repeat protein [Chitinophagaceae bacterium]